MNSLKWLCTTGSWAFTILALIAAMAWCHALDSKSGRLRDGLAVVVILIIALLFAVGQFYLDGVT